MGKCYYRVDRKKFDKELARKIRKYSERGVNKRLSIDLWNYVGSQDSDTIEVFTELLWEME